MNKYRFVGWGLVASITIAVIAVAFSYDANLQNALYTIAGFGYIIFGTWAAVLLLSLRCKK